jgi:hypothetical protein
LPLELSLLIIATNALTTRFMTTKQMQWANAGTGTLDSPVKCRDTTCESANRVDPNRKPGLAAGFCFHSCMEQSARSSCMVSNPSFLGLPHIQQEHTFPWFAKSPAFFSLVDQHS